MVINNKRGFSLIEFFIAIGIIALLLLASTQTLVDTLKEKKRVEIMTLVSDIISLNNQTLANKKLILKYLGADINLNLNKCISGNASVDCTAFSKTLLTSPVSLGVGDLNGRMLGTKGFCNDFANDTTCLLKNTFNYTLACSVSACDNLEFEIDIHYKSFVGQDSSLAHKKRYSIKVPLSQFRELGQIKNPDLACKIITGLDFLDRSFECDKTVEPPNYLCDISPGGVCSTSYISMPTESVFNATFGATTNNVYWVNSAKKMFPSIADLYDPSASKIKLCFSIEMDRYKKDYSAQSLQIRCPETVLKKSSTLIKGSDISINSKNFSTDTASVIFDQEALWKINGFDPIPSTSVSAPKVDNVCVDFDLGDYFRSLNDLKTVSKWIDWEKEIPQTHCLVGNPVSHTVSYECRIETIKENGLVSASRPVSFQIEQPLIIWLGCGVSKLPTAVNTKSNVGVAPPVPDPPSYAP